jgi:hypothetical protein
MFSGRPVLHNVRCLSKFPVTLRCPHICQQCFLLLIAFSNSDILSYDHFSATEWTTGVDGFTFPLHKKYSFHAQARCTKENSLFFGILSISLFSHRVTCVTADTMRNLHSTLSGKFSCLFLNRDIIVALASDLHCSSLHRSSFAWCLERFKSQTKIFNLLCWSDVVRDHLWARSWDRMM